MPRIDIYFIEDNYFKIHEMYTAIKKIKFNDCQFEFNYITSDYKIEKVDSNQVCGCNYYTNIDDVDHRNSFVNSLKEICKNEKSIIILDAFLTKEENESSHNNALNLPTLREIVNIIKKEKEIYHVIIQSVARGFVNGGWKVTLGYDRNVTIDNIDFISYKSLNGSEDGDIEEFKNFIDEEIFKKKDD